MTNPQRQAQNQRSPKARPGQSRPAFPAPAQPRRAASPQPTPAAATNGDGYLSVEVDDGFLAAIDKARALLGLSREDFCIAALRERMARLSAERVSYPAGLSDVTCVPGNSDVYEAVQQAVALIDMLAAVAYPPNPTEPNRRVMAASCGVGGLVQLTQDMLVSTVQSYDQLWQRYLERHLPQAFAKPSTQPEAA